jgi:Heavy metal binding domain
MKQIILFLALFTTFAGGSYWLARQPAVSAAIQSSDGRKVLYYQSPMHPWIKSDKPGKCPICGMNLVPIYADAETSTGLKLSVDSVKVANIRTAPVGQRAISRTIRVAGKIQLDGQSPRFRFTAYERDLSWIKPGQPVELALPGEPGKIYRAVIAPGDWSSPHSNKIVSPTGITLSADISAPAKPDAARKGWPALEGTYAEGRIEVQTPPLLAIPRSAVLAGDEQPRVYVAVDSNRYEPRKVTLGLVGDDFAGVVSGLQAGEMVVTSGNLAIDAEVQISRVAKQ